MMQPNALKNATSRGAGKKGEGSRLNQKGGEGI